VRASPNLSHVFVRLRAVTTATPSLGTLSLGDDQRRVVEHPSGPLLARGGPGTGKTLCLKQRFLRLAGLPGCSPDRVLFLVLSRSQKIALQDELTRRLLFEDRREAILDVPVYTWHGLANHLVTRHYDRLAYSEPPVLLTSPEQWASVREALLGENEANWPHHKHLLKNRGFVDEVVDFVLRVEQRLLEDSDLDRIVAARPQWAGLVRFLKHHRDQQRARARVDYPTLLRDAAELIANYDDVRDGLHRRFLHVLVDDGQELSFVQQRLLSFLAGSGGGFRIDRSLVVAADADSAIEHFRGADPAWLDDFDRDFGPAEKVTLQRSYRLGPELAERATSVVANDNPARHRARSFAGNTALEVHRYGSLASEVEAVARELRLAHLRDRVPYEAMAVLLTSPRAMLPALERALAAVEVPYSITAPDRPLEREGVVHTFCELARFAHGEEDDARLVELLRSPLTGLHTHEVRELERAARAQGVTLSDYVDNLGTAAGTDGRIGHLLSLRDILRDTRAAPADESFWRVWQSGSHYAALRERSRADLASEANRDLDALVAFARALGRFVERRRGRATLEQYLDAITRADFGSDPWLPPERTRERAVQILSFHAARGREWDLVAVCGVVDGAIPKGRRAQGLFDPYFLEEISASERARRNEAEDRRVFYVALTRARKRCIVTLSPGPSRKAQPSRYVAELVGELPEIERETERSPLTLSEAAARCRRLLGDVELPATARLAALAAVIHICATDRSCSAAQPSEWWWRWDWTEGAPGINEQTPRDEGVPDGKLRTSYSRISHYDNCPLAYLCSVVLGLDPDVTHNLDFGRWIHEIIEDCEKEPTDEQKRLGRRRLTNRNMVFERYGEIFDAAVFPNQVVARQFERDGRLMLENYMKYMRPGTAHMAEHRFRVDVDGHVITGRIDRVDKKGKHLIVSDYKTSRSELQWADAKESLQLAIYYKAAREDPELSEHGEPCSMQLVYPFKIVKGDISKRCQTPAEAEEVLVRLPELIDGVLGEQYAPSPEADCRWCKFKPICPLWAEGRELQP
jgi:superfamily I DNA/RNA helicase